MLTNFLKEFVGEFDQLAQKIDSEQFELSGQFIKHKHRLGINQEEMAELLGISLNQYLDMEQGSVDYEVKVYKNMLDKINKKTFSFDNYSTKRQIKSDFILNTFKTKKHLKYLEQNSKSAKTTEDMKINGSSNVLEKNLKFSSGNKYNFKEINLGAA